MPSFHAIIAIAIVAFSSVAAGQSQGKKIEVQLVKYEGLKQEVLKHRGKVVVLDFWATTCTPCMQHFPRYRRDAKKTRRQRACRHLRVDRQNRKGTSSIAVNRFLTKQNFRSQLTVDESPEILIGQLDYKSLPFTTFLIATANGCVFGRSITRRSPEAYEELDQTVVKMLSEK